MYQRLSKLRERRAAGESGFTLIELLVVVVIIGILIAIAIPVYLNYQKGAKDKSADSDLRNAISVLEQCNSDNGSYPVSLTSTATPGAITASVTLAAVNGCVGQTINVTAGTSLSYYPISSTNLTGYSLVGFNSGGSTNKYYCYSSVVGGSVKNESSVTAAYTPACA